MEALSRAIQKSLRFYIGDAERTQRIAWVLGFSAVVYLGIVFLTNLSKATDFGAFYDTGYGFWHGLKPYVPGPHSDGEVLPYMPFFGLLMTPWALLPFEVAVPLWTALKLGCYYWFFICFAALLHEVKLSRQQIFCVFFLVLLFVINSIVRDFIVGQINLYVITGMTAAAVLGYRNDRRHEWLAAVIFSIVSLKIVPYIMLPYFFVTKKWRLLGKIAAVHAVIFGLFIGWHGVNYAEEVVRGFIQYTNGQKLSIAELTYYKNQSLIALVARITAVFTGGCAMNLHDASLCQTSPYFTWIRGVATVLNLLLIAACMAVVTRARHMRNEVTSLLDLWQELALVEVTMLLASPDSRLLHLIGLIVPLLLFFREMLLPLNNPLRLRISTIGLCACAVSLIGFSSDLIGIDRSVIFGHFAVHTMVLMVLWGGLVALVLKKGQSLDCPIPHGDTRGRPYFID